MYDDFEYHDFEKLDHPVEIDFIKEFCMWISTNFRASLDESRRRRPRWRTVDNTLETVRHSDDLSLHQKSRFERTYLKTSLSSDIRILIDFILYCVELHFSGLSSVFTSFTNYL